LTTPVKKREVLPSFSLCESDLYEDNIQKTQETTQSTSLNNDAQTHNEGGLSRFTRGQLQWHRL